VLEVFRETVVDEGFMAAHTILFEEDQKALTAICEELLQDALAKAIFLVDRNGQLIAMTGQTASIDTTSLASLVAGTVAATGGLAKLIGEEEFPNHAHEGDKENLHLSIVGEEHILTVFYDERSSLGLVRLRVKKTTRKMVDVFEKAKNKATDSFSDDFFSEITDEDIDNLFSDAF
jgi:predicted regulator of Ras-like GTPase activity (Roadblock/LC7/MglB family)